MESHSTNYDQLIASILSGNSNPSEIEALEQWQNLSKENKEIFDDSVIVWNSCRKPLTKAEIARDKLHVEEQIITKISLQQKRDRFAIRLLRMVAVLVGPIMLALGWYYGSSTNYSKDLTWNTVTAPKKHIAVCTLSDGTEVWLNAGSTISYPANPTSGERQVRLSGEGYFKVTKDPKNPFFVMTQQATVKVLGTSFNMKAYPGEERLVTTLEEGSIELFTQKSGETSLKLHPGEQAIYNNKRGETIIEKVDAARFSAWRTDKFLFKDADLKTIITELERLYDIKIHIKNPQLEKLRFRGMFSYDQDLLDAFETLKLSVKLKYTIKDREVWLE